MATKSTYEETVKRVKDFQKNAAAKSASATDQSQKGNPKGTTVSETDPNQQGEMNPKLTPGESADAQNLPSNRNEIKPAEIPTVVDQLNPGEVGTDVPSTQNGDKKDDAANSPTVDLSKIATDARSIAARIKAVGVPKSATAAKQTAPTKIAAASDLPAQLGADYLVKLATEILRSEEGVRFAEQVLTKSAGAETARNLLQMAQAQHDEYVKEAQAQAEWQKSAAAQEQAFNEALDELYKNASTEERAQMDKIASVHSAALDKITDPIEKAAYQQGAMDAASMAQSQGGDPAAEGQLPGGEDGPASLEQIVQILQQAVQAGEIDPQTAEAVLKDLAGQAGGGDAGAPAPGGDAGGAMPPGGPEAGAPPDAGASPEAAAPGDPAELAKAASLFAKLVDGK